LVTGGADRIGKALALSLAEKGYNIFLHYNSSLDKAKDTQQLIEKTGRHCILKQANFYQQEAVQALIKDCLDDGPIEILVNSASNFVKSTMETEGTALLEQLFETNFKAPYILTKQFARHCQKGLIVNLLDTKINKHQTQHLDYLLTKKALEAFTQLTAVQLAPHIRVNAIAPGLILPPEGQTEVYLQQMAQHIPLQQTGSLEQVAGAMEF